MISNDSEKSYIDMNDRDLNIPYRAFDHFVFRAPVFPMSFVNKLYNTGLSDFLKERSPIIDHAIYLASPNLYRKIDRRISGDLKEDSLNFDLSLLKYLTRMSTRCTPFGLFAGIGTGQFDDHSGIVLDVPEAHNTHTKLSQDFLFALYSRISTDPEVARSSTYFTNNTLYRKHNHLRYIEYKDENRSRKHTLSSVEVNDVLLDIIQMCLGGCSWKELLLYLGKMDIPSEEAENYLRLLVENQVITNQLEPTPISEDSLTQFIQKLCSIRGGTKHYVFCQDLYKSLQNLDETGVVFNIDEYRCINKKLEEYFPDLKASGTFHVDVGLRTKKSTLATSLIEEVQKGVDALNRLTSPKQHQFLTRFRQQFFSRYENEEIPLVEALDSESGIPVDDTDKKDMNPMIEDIPLGRSEGSEFMQFDLQQKYMVEEYFDYLERQQPDSIPEPLKLNEEKLKNLPVTWDDIPVTFSVMAEIVSNSAGSPLVYLKAVTGINAAKTLSRFHQLSPELKKLIVEIADKEKRFYADSVIAEILHIPQTRTGNVLIRPDVYDYQIPIVTLSTKSLRYQIPVHDIMISVVNGQTIRLRSKRLNKWIVPRLSTAHNFTHDSIPIYRFLCYVQMQDIRPDLTFRWNNLLTGRKFLPRVTYGNVVLATATWNFTSQDLPGNLDLESDGFHRSMQEFKEQNQLPERVLLTRGDRRLLIDFTRLQSCQMFYGEANKKAFTVKEFFPDFGNSLITDSHNSFFAAEYIFGFYRNRL